ncbi:hypothetical protein N7493_000025 [Penicillium malachiteum]|uniref:Cytochrome P450 n=1 Tax=Penicillium malachiteum TaxID=1324776 RepID=A0AAD6HVI9_9EURO|nr:hypothetical protein N7493_000025 [Penicillium malachiteum]
MLSLRHLAVFAYAFPLNLRRLWNLVRWPKSAQPEQTVGSIDRRGRVSDPCLCRQLIEGKLTRGSNCNQLSLPQSMAIPNEGLRTVFGIDNAFTSHDPELVKAFVDAARGRIKMKPEEWSALTPMIVDVARRMIFDFNIDGMDGLRGPALSKEPGVPSFVKFNITSLVQVVSLRAILATVLKDEAKGSPSDLEILKLADQINKGWIQARKGTKDGTDILSFEHNEDLKTSLEAVFPHQAEYESNPLNILLPSFETMWRVVLRLLLELKFRTSRKNPEWAKVMISFCWNVNKERFQERRTPQVKLAKTKAVVVENSKSSQEKTPSAKDIVLEALRVYPPTRRIYRAYAWGDSQASCKLGSVDIDDMPSQLPFRIVAADIESCHLETDIWGTNAAVFDPTRWMNTTRAQIHAFMPFGYGVCECPAKAVFGPRMIGTLVGALLSALDDDECQWELWCTDDNMMNHLARKERLYLDRDAYDELEVIQVCSSS